MGYQSTLGGRGTDSRLRRPKRSARGGGLHKPIAGPARRMKLPRRAGFLAWSAKRSYITDNRMVVDGRNPQENKSRLN